MKNILVAGFLFFAFNVSAQYTRDSITEIRLIPIQQKESGGDISETIIEDSIFGGLGITSQYPGQQIMYSLSRAIRSDEELGVLIVGSIPDSSFLDICLSRNAGNHWVYARMANSGTAYPTHENGSYGYSYVRFHVTLSAEYTFPYLTIMRPFRWDMGNGKDVLIDVVKLYAITQIQLDTVVTVKKDTVIKRDTVKSYVRSGDIVSPDEVTEIYSVIGSYLATESVSAFRKRARSGLYFTKKGKFIVRH